MADDREQELTRRIEDLEKEVSDLKRQVEFLKDRLRKAETSLPNPAY